MNINNINKFSVNDIVSYNSNQLESYIDYITMQNLAEGDIKRAKIKNEEELEQYRCKVRESFMRAIGGLPEMGNVKSVVNRRFLTDGLICENIILETLPGFYATANVYKPQDIQDSLPAVLMMCGHAPEGRLYDVYQRVQRCIAKAGFVVMGLDPIGQGERVTYIEEGQSELAVSASTYEHNYAGVQCLMTGLTITRYFVHDGICAINYLMDRKDVDETRIGITGSSGGGTQASMLLMTVPEKIAAAALGTFITDREAILLSRQAQDLEQIWLGMVSDGFDHADILACMAPKPVMLLTTDSDFFPLEGTKRTIHKVKELWGLFEKEENLEIVTDASKHVFTWNLANAAADFFSRTLKGEPCLPIKQISVDKKRDLHATETGSVVTTLKSRIIHDYVKYELDRIDICNSKIPYEQRRENAKQFVSKQVYNYEPYPLYIKRSYERTNIFNLEMELFAWYQQEKILSFGVLIKPPNEKINKIMIATWDGGVTMLHYHFDKIMLYCEQGYSVFVLDLVGTGSLSNGYYSPDEPDYFHTKFGNFANNLLVNNDNIVAMRVRGICRALDALEDIFGHNICFDVMTYGKYNLYAWLAKLVDDRVSSIIEYDPLKSIRELADKKYYNNHNIMALVMPGMLSYFDIEDLRMFSRTDN